MVNLTSLLASGSLFFFTDFNKNHLDLANSGTSDLNPIISFPPDLTSANTNQRWQLIPMGGTFLQIQNALGPFLSYPTAASSGSVGFSAAVSSSSFPMNFTVIQSNTSDSSYVFREVISGEVLTALSLSVEEMEGTPVTFSFLGNVARPAQIWTLEQAA